MKRIYKMEKFFIDTDGRQICCFITRKNVKNINMTVRSDGIHISASKYVPLKYIQELILKKKQFIKNALERLDIQANANSPESIRKICYLGRIYPVNIHKSEHESLEFGGQEFDVFSPDCSISSIRLAIKKWYMKNALIIFQKANEYTYNEFQKRGYRTPHAVVTIKEMKTRWGSCNAARGKISMNLRLMEYPEECVYGVFFHEYTHFIHQNHSKDFYKVLYEMYPQYKKTDEILKKPAALANNFSPR